MDLEDDFDVVIIGTGLPESIISAACSRIGKTVLHLDNNSFYGENWGSFNFEQLVEYLKFGKINDSLIFHPLSSDKKDKDEQGLNNDQCINWSDFYKTITNVEIISYLLENEDKTNELNNDENKDDEKWYCENDFKKLSRKFNIDLCPKLLFSSGSMVQLLVSSNISRYMSFKSVTRLLCNKDNDLELIQVPYSRQTVFLSNISLIEKRCLMKFIQFCLDADKNESLLVEFKNKPFKLLMDNKNLTPFLQKIIMNCVLFTDDKNITMETAIDLLKKFVNSSGRYGSTPFLSTLYGSGEIPQSFCRLSAVFAGTFLLNNSIQKLSMVETNNDFEGIKLYLSEKKIKTKFLVSSLESTPKNLINSEEKKLLSRGIFITDKSLKKIEDENDLNKDISLICIDFDDNSSNVYILELSSSLCVCPDNFYLVYMWTESKFNCAKNDLLPVVKKLFNFTGKNGSDCEKPNLIWSCYYNTEFINGFKNRNSIKNHFILSNSFNELDYDFNVKESKEVFKKMFPEEEFLPRAPEPNEIVYDFQPKIDEQINGNKEADNSE